MKLDAPKGEHKDNKRELKQVYKDQTIQVKDLWRQVDPGTWSLSSIVCSPHKIPTMSRGTERKRM